MERQMGKKLGGVAEREIVIGYILWGSKKTLSIKWTVKCEENKMVLQKTSKYTNIHAMSKRIDTKKG